MRQTNSFEMFFVKCHSLKELIDKQQIVVILKMGNLRCLESLRENVN